MPQNELRSLLTRVGAAHAAAPGRLEGAGAAVELSALMRRSALSAEAGRLVERRCVLLLTQDPLAAALALIELDGRAARVVLVPPGVPDDHLCRIAATAQAQAIAGDAQQIPAALAHLAVARIDPARLAQARETGPGAREPTEWVLLTSGTSGVPKLVVHTLQTLCGAIVAAGALAGPKVWGTFYDLRRYGGLQILLRALVGGGSLVLTHPQEGIDAFVGRVVGAGVTHLTGTPSHWRRALMNPALLGLRPQYARMSGEIADQGIIDRLRAAFAGARVAHAYASTEAGVGFEVDDGLEGFPAQWVGAERDGVVLEVAADTLRIRSGRTGLRYLGEDAGALHDERGFVDTGDVVELRGGRYHFAGRRGGIINVGGLKVHPEEIEAVINRHPRVRMSVVRARKSPITGAVVVADVVPTDAEGAGPAAQTGLEQEILDLCRAGLAGYKVPAVIRLVPRIDVTDSGKITRVDG
jgi:acyl-CoA synthetase (AMP-forming)/AMP-acid ligase II